MNLDLLKSSVCVTLFLGIFLLAHAAATASMPSATRAGLRGLKRQRALAKGSGWAQIEPVVRWGGRRVSPFLSKQLTASLDRQIGLAGGFLGLVPEELVSLSILSGMVGALAGCAAAPVVNLGPLVPFAVAAFGAVAPFLWLSSEATERATAIGRRLPNAIDLIALGMGAGLDFPGAVKQTIDKSGTPDDPLLEELALVLQSLQLGRTRRQALEELAERAPIDPVRELVGAVVQAELRGNPLADVLRIQAEVSRQRRSVRAEEAAAKAAISMIGPLVLVFIAILILVLGPIVIRLKQTGL
jgi:tight adherence protein C